MAAHWGYNVTNGPSTWVKQFPIAAGQNQSPVDIVTSDAVFDGNLTARGPLTTFYKMEKELKITNNGHSVQAIINESSELTGGPLQNKYKLEQFHLHWGSNDNKGSEHTVDGKACAAELHLVHWNAEKYRSFAEAVDKPDGLAVLGIMIVCGVENTAFKQLADAMTNVVKKNDAFTIASNFNPASLLPGNTSDYWTYHGSLTTPPLYESVQWIVFRQPVEYSRNQLQALRSLKNEVGTNIQDNFRPPLPLQGRQLRASFNATGL